MYRILVLTFFTGMIACNSETKTANAETTASENELVTPPLYPFGYTLSEFITLPPVARSGGDCDGSKTEYRKDNILLIADTANCYDYGSSTAYYLIQGDSLLIAHVRDVSNEYDETAGKPVKILNEVIYDFTARPVRVFYRGDTSDHADFKLIKKAFIDSTMKNAQEEYQLFKQNLK